MFLKTYAIDLGVQVPTTEVHVVPPEVDAGMYNCSPTSIIQITDHCSHLTILFVILVSPWM